jgi:hypothetical protein
MRRSFRPLDVVTRMEELRAKLRTSAETGLEAVLAYEACEAAWRAQAALVNGDWDTAATEAQRASSLDKHAVGAPLDLRLLDSPGLLLAALRAGMGSAATTATAGELEIVLHLDEATASAAVTAPSAVAERGILCDGFELRGPAAWTSNAGGVVAAVPGSSDGHSLLGPLWLSAEGRERLSLTTHPPLRLFRGRRLLGHVRVRAPKLDTMTWRMVRLTIDP